MSLLNTMLGLPGQKAFRAGALSPHAPSRSGCCLCRRNSPAKRAAKRLRSTLGEVRAEEAPQKVPEEDSEDSLLPEEDWTVPGGYQDSLSKNTQLGKAVDEACKELDSLGELERESLVKANELLKKLGYKGDITAPQIPPKADPDARQ